MFPPYQNISKENINMNNKKKILITLGSFGVIATPIVSSVSFAEKETVQGWKDFYNQVNDVSKDTKALVN